MKHLLLFSLLLAAAAAVAVAGVPWCRETRLDHQSVQGRNLTLVVIGLDEESHPKPYFRWIGNIHGKEVVGRYLLEQLIDEICSPGSYNEWRDVIEGMYTYIVPSMNPDGYALRRRSNANHKDLNRNFPELLHSSRQRRSNREPLQPETAAVMTLERSRPFGISTSLHGGSLVANYPYDADRSRRAPDDALLHELARLYASHHPRMANGTGQFPDGTVRGGDWYLLYGGLQDWAYQTQRTMALTIEVSENKDPAESELPGFWGRNRAAMAALMRRALGSGVVGRVKSGRIGIDVLIPGTERISVETFPPDGRFYRPLPLGDALRYIELGDQ